MSFAEKFKNTVHDNFELSAEKYTELEDKIGHFKDMSEVLTNFAYATGGGDPKSILDVGTGTGSAIEVLRKHFTFAKLYGIDISENMLDVARERYPFADFTCGDAEALENYYEEELFDFIIYPASLFLLPNQEASLAGAKKLLRPEGLVAASILGGLSEKEGRAVKSLPVSTSIIKNESLVSLFSKYFGAVRHERHEIELGEDRARGFYRIEAQSAGLFPGKAYEERIELLEEVLGDARKNNFTLIQSWDLIAAKLP
ncbi:MAG: class I SAM-dependent methyltransferase [Clostridiales Family XIII bacterium]|jgi:ubiquinone/menaquinone biosynthesis C-methylase UbiE|nr:class I SAM-dependent methyltransferase [Clostridiales Family XIII bacterium]